MSREADTCRWPACDPAWGAFCRFCQLLAGMSAVHETVKSREVALSFWAC